MLDVYRTYYKLTGEPFRLGPDHRFSLHHASYANAKAYLEFAIYQGEGFIAITGGPGTGKTTLISEILAGLDRDKIEVATLTSTQLESRDLLHMVASSFGLHPEKVNKADLLLEIESFLVNKIRNGHRAILIVDEAQGLSGGALEELRLLANLQYQYQLLLQIFLVGQERLLELIRSPGMEHLQQRLVAATALEPLSFDETIDYIEHRLSRVGWKGDPAIEEAALRLVYCYSGGIPRRVNLITNRLFLYGGMQEKHCFTGEDARNVIDGLIEEFLLPPEPLLAEDAIKVAPTTPGQRTKVRSLPRSTGEPAAAATPNRAVKSGGGAPSSEDEPTQRRDAAPQPEPRKRPSPANFKLDNESMPGSRPQSRVARGNGQKPAAAPAPRDQARHPASRHAVPERDRKNDRSVGTRPLEEAEDENEGGSKGLLVFALLLVGAGAAYFLFDKSIDLDRIYKLVSDTTGIELQLPQAPEVAGGRLARTEVIPAPLEEEPASVTQDLEATPPDAPEDIQAADKGPIIRAQANGVPEEAGMTKVASNMDMAVAAPGQTESPREVPPEAPLEAPETKTAEQAPQAAPAPPGPVRDSQVVTQPGLPLPVVKGNTDVVGRVPAEAAGTSMPVVASWAADKGQESPAFPAAAEPKQPQAESAAPQPATPKPAAKPVAPVVVATTVASNTHTVPATLPIDAQHERLKQAAEKRFSEQVARIQSGVASAPVAPARAATAPPASSPEITLSRAEPPSAPPPVNKTPPLTPAEIKATLLQGRWSSSGKPASLLPSETTFCGDNGDRIWCASVPQEVKTQYGPALYKVETTLTRFSAEGHFEMSYRTLVKLVGAEGPAAAGGDWQVTEYSMSCTLTDPDQVSCLDGKGITRRYLRIESGKT